MLDWNLSMESEVFQQIFDTPENLDFFTIDNQCITKYGMVIEIHFTSQTSQ